VSVPHLATQLSQQAPYAPVPATYGQRVGGFLIDIGIPMGVVFTVLIAALIPRDRTLALVAYALSAVVAIIFVLWNSGYRQGRTGQSLGKRALGVRLVAAAHGAPGDYAHLTVALAPTATELLPAASELSPMATVGSAIARACS